MKKKALLITSVLLTLAASVMGQYVDDIYYNPRKASNTEVNSAVNKETVVIYNNVRDVDEYNRQSSSRQLNTQSSSVLDQNDLEYSSRITRFHNPEALTINNAENVYIYNNTIPTSQSRVNVHVNNRWNPWGYSYTTRYYYPSYHWNSWYGGVSWGFSYNSYYPFYTIYPSPFYYGYYPPVYRHYGYSSWGHPYYYSYGYYPYRYHHRPIIHTTTTTRRGYDNYQRTPNYSNDGRRSSSSYNTYDAGQRSTRSVSSNNNTSTNTTRNTGTYNTGGRTFNSSSTTQPSSSESTRSSRVTTSPERSTAPAVRESNSGRSFNNTSTTPASNSSNSGTRSTSSSSNSNSSSESGNRSGGGRSFGR